MTPSSEKRPSPLLEYGGDCLSPNEKTIPVGLFFVRHDHFVLAVFTLPTRAGCLREWRGKDRQPESVSTPLVELLLNWLVSQEIEHGAFRPATGGETDICVLSVSLGGSNLGRL